MIWRRRDSSHRVEERVRRATKQTGSLSAVVAERLRKLRTRFALFLAALATILILSSIWMVDSKEPQTANIEVPLAEGDLPPTKIRRDIEAQMSFKQAKVLTVPKTFSVLGEEYYQYPLIEIMKGKRYLAITDPYAPHDSIARSAELTSLGRRFLGSYILEDSEKYSVTIARRRFVRLLQFGTDGQLVYAKFGWTWEPVNDVGQFFSFWSADRMHDTQPSGSIRYEKRGSRWMVHSCSITDPSLLRIRDSGEVASER